MPSYFRQYSKQYLTVSLLNSRLATLAIICTRSSLLHTWTNELEAKLTTVVVVFPPIVLQQMKMSVVKRQYALQNFLHPRGQSFLNCI